jgi:hypothetical protein
MSQKCSLVRFTIEKQNAKMSRQNNEIKKNGRGVKASKGSTPENRFAQSLARSAQETSD